MDISVFKAVPSFKDIDAKDLEAFSQLTSKTSLRRGDSFFHEGDEGDYLYIVTDGKVKLSHSLDNDRENLIAVLDLGEIIDELLLFDLGAHPSMVTAIALTRLISLVHKDMMNFINQHPDMVITMLQGLARRLRNTNEQMADLVSPDVLGRAARALTDLANRFGERTPEGTYVVHDLIQEELTHLVDASRETVDKSLADFVSRGQIRLEGGAVPLIEVGRLQHRAC